MTTKRPEYYYDLIEDVTSEDERPEMPMTADIALSLLHEFFDGRAMSDDLLKRAMAYLVVRLKVGA